ncbi:replication protein A, subunit RPA32 [Marasmius fiardii PR-910]|nr:replication protein A, subunit RPA32 [Marasmius fiardii PR-910]
MSQDYYGGGGFTTNSPFSGSADGSPSSGGRGRGDWAHSLTPVFITQLYQATQAHADADWRLGDVELGQITLVGHVVEIKKQSSHITYKFEDHLGQIEARTWMEGADDNENKWGVKVHEYARVMGTLKAFGGKRYINAVHLRPIVDSHEIAFHQFEVYTVYLTNKNGPPKTPGGANRAGNAGASTSGGSGPGISAYSASTSNTSSNDHPEYAHLPALQQKLLRAILASPEHDEGGAYVGNIAQAVGGVAGDISDALDQLMDGGYIYNTSDDSHFMVSR